MKITNDELMEYVDGTLASDRVAEVEAHLAANPEEAELVASMKLAMGALHEWDEAEPVKVSDDFWPRLREQLPARPGRSFASRLMGLLWPVNSRVGISIRAAVVAAVLFLAVTWLAPRQQVNTVTADEVQFIQQSLKRHKAYTSSQPLGATVAPGDGAAAVGDIHGADRPSQDDDAHDNAP